MMINHHVQAALARDRQATLRAEAASAPAWPGGPGRAGPPPGQRVRRPYCVTGRAC